MSFRWIGSTPAQVMAAMRRPEEVRYCKQGSDMAATLFAAMVIDGAYTSNGRL